MDRLNYYNRKTDLNKDLMLKSWLCKAIDMASSRKRTRLIAEIRDDFEFVPMLKRIRLKEETEEYLDLTKRFEAAVKDVLVGADDSSVAEKYELDLETLREEIRRYKNSLAEMYEYNGNGRIFSYKEELMLLEILATIPQARCICQSCTLERLPYVAYFVARRKNKSYPSEWDKNQQAGKGWQTNFEIVYEYELSNSFPAECKLMQDNPNELQKT